MPPGDPERRALISARDGQSTTMTLYTIGHSTRPAPEFVALLDAHRIRQLVDVRTIPRSRHNPQFNADALAATLDAAGIGYQHMASLGGLRRPE